MPVNSSAKESILFFASFFGPDITLAINYFLPASTPRFPPAPNTSPPPHAHRFFKSHSFPSLRCKFLFQYRDVLFSTINLNFLFQSFFQLSYILPSRNLCQWPTQGPVNTSHGPHDHIRPLQLNFPACSYFHGHGIRGWALVTWFPHRDYGHWA